MSTTSDANTSSPDQPPRWFDHPEAQAILAQIAVSGCPSTYIEKPRFKRGTECVFEGTVYYGPLVDRLDPLYDAAWAAAAAIEPYDRANIKAVMDQGGPQAVIAATIENARAAA